jgi:hypothetical protein
MRLYCNGWTLDRAWDDGRKFKVKGTTFDLLANVAPKTTKNLKQYAKDWCLRVIHREEVGSLFYQGSMEIPVEVVK